MLAVFASVDLRLAVSLLEHLHATVSFLRVHFF